MYVRVLQLKKVTAHKEQMLCVSLFFKRQGDSKTVVALNIQFSTDLFR